MTNSLKGLGLLALNILHLISIGAKEKIETINTCIEKNNVIEYLTKKYKDHFFIAFDNTIYNNSQLNAYFHNYCGYIEGNEERKYGIMGEDSGLLLLLALITDKVEEHSYEWTVE